MVPVFVRFADVTLAEVYINGAHVEAVWADPTYAERCYVRLHTGTEYNLLVPAQTVVAAIRHAIPRGAL